MAQRIICKVCGYEFQDKDEAKGFYTCPYCNTKAAVLNKEDGDRRVQISNGYTALRQSKIVEAAQIFNDYVATYQDNNNSEVNLGKALANCGVSMTLSYNGNEAIPVVHKEHLDEDFLTKLKDVEKENELIYNKIYNLYENDIRFNYQKNANAALIISLDIDGKIFLENTFDQLGRAYISVDITSKDCENRIYKNISSCNGLFVYVNENSHLHTNAYFLSIYNRLKRKNKTVTFIKATSNAVVDAAFAKEHALLASDVNIKDKIVKILQGGSLEKSANVVDGAEIVEIKEKNVVVSTGINKIAPYAAEKFKDVTSLEIIVPVPVVIGKRAFANSHIESVRVSNAKCSLKLDDGAFENCKALNSVSFDNDDVTLGVGVFESCENLYAINLKNTKIDKLPSSTFANCTVLKNIELPTTLKCIERRAFYKTNIEEIHIFSHTVIKANAFERCDNLTKVYIECSNLNDSSINIEDDAFNNENIEFVFCGASLKKSFKTFKKVNKKKNYRVSLVK